MAANPEVDLKKPLSFSTESPSNMPRQTSRHSVGNPMSLLLDASSRCHGQDDEVLSLEWKGLTFLINGRPILKDVTGLVEPGRLTAVLGPSGSGKTTLLNILAGRQRPNTSGMSLHGEITALGQRIDPAAFRTNIAYVMQEDTTLAFETPRECLNFSAYLRLPSSVSPERRHEFVENLLATLHLEKCANTIIGSQLVKGISGGEKKRTCVGIELIGNPKVLFLDEPLSGLDSYAAFTLVEALKALAEAGVPVLCTVHQPSSEIFAMFDDIILLHDGSVAFHGPAEQLSTYFDALGYTCPANFNPADHVMFMLQKEPPAKIVDIKNAWKSSGLCNALTLKVEQKRRSSSSSTAFSNVHSDGPSFSRQLCVLCARELRGTLRNKGILYARFGMALFLGGLYAWLFAGSASGTACDGNPLDPTFGAACTGDFQAHFGSLVSISVMAMMGAAQPILLQFPAERPVFLKEHAAGQYGVIPYFISKTLTELPVVLVGQSLLISVVYWPMGLYEHHQYFAIILCSWTLGVASSSLALLVGCGVASSQKAIQLAPLTLIPQMLFSGLFLPVGKIPESLRWVRFLCPLKYAINLMAMAEFSDVKRRLDDCEAEHPAPVCKQTHAGDYLQYGLLDGQSIVWDDWAFYVSALLGLLLGFRVLATILLWRKGKYVF